MTANADVKERLIACCDELVEVANEKAVEYGESVLKNLEDLKAAIRSHVFKVYLVGEFSCGKSSLLNRWLGRDMLFTGLTPKTAVSSELHYSEREHMVLQSLDPKIPDQDLQGISEANLAIVQERANASELANVVLYVNNPQLRKYVDLCLVDLPGLSSANAAHELALNRFLEERQSVAVFCVPMTDGTIQDSSLSFLRKMDSFGRIRRFEFLLTKADERLESEQEDTRAAVRRQLALYGLDNAFVGKVSRESVEDFEHLISSYRQKKNDYLLRWFGDKIKTVAGGMLESLRIALSAQYDNSRIEDALAKIEETEKALPQLTEELNADLQRSAQSQISDVLASVRESVRGQKAALFSQSQNGGNCAESVASIIRSTVASRAPMAVQSAMSDVCEHSGGVLDEKLDFDLSPVPVEPQVVGNDNPLDVFIDKSDPLDNVMSSLRKSDNSFAQCCGWGWQIGTVGATLANFIAPGSGLFTAMTLGGLATFFTEGFGSRSEERGRQEAEFEMRLNEACEAARPAISAAIENAIAQSGAKLQASMEEKVRNLHEQIRTLKAESEAGKAEWEAHQAERRTARERITAIMTQLEG